MTEDLERLRFPIGPFEMPEDVGPTWREHAINEVAATPAVLRSAVEDLSDEQLDTRYRPGGWTVRQVVHHLPDSHLNSYVRFKLALTETNPEISTYEEAPWAELPDSRGPIAVSLTLLDALHERWVGLLRELDDTQWQRTLRHPEWGTLTVAQLLAIYAWHGPHHVAHVTSLRQREGW